jgi:hypothetical protein
MIPKVIFFHLLSPGGVMADYKKLQEDFDALIEGELESEEVKSEIFGL